MSPRRSEGKGASKSKSKSKAKSKSQSKRGRRGKASEAAAPDEDAPGRATTETPSEASAAAQQVSARVDKLRGRPWTERVEGIEAMIDELRARPSGVDLRVLVEGLLALAADDKWEVRRAIARGLVHIEHPLFETIAERLESDANQYVAQAARSAADRRRELDREYQRKTDEIDVVAGEVRKLREEHGDKLAAAAERLANHQFRLLTNEITHEMRTVVAGLLDALNKLHANLEGSRTPKKVYERTLGISRDRARFLKLMLEDTKKLVDEPRHELEDVEIGELLEKVCGLVRDALEIPDEVGLEVELDTRPGAKVHVPRGRLLQALSSLVKNAIEACEDQGKVTIHTSAPRRGWIAIDIVDDGYGMEAEEIRRALLPMVSTKKDDQHTGVGLPLARKIIERECRGEFTIESAPEQGTTVRCLLPKSRENL